MQIWTNELKHACFIPIGASCLLPWSALEEKTQLKCMVKRAENTKDIKVSSKMEQLWSLGQKHI